MAFEKNNTIGIILPNITNQFSAMFLTLASAALKKQGFGAVFSITEHNVLTERELFTYFGAATNGILVLSSAIDYEEISDCVPTDIPVIFFNRKPNGCDRCCILASDYSAVYQAVLSMERLGHTRIACVCDKAGYSTTKEIVSAYQDAMKNIGVDFKEDWIYYTDNHNVDVAGLVEDVSAKGCDAILTATHTLTDRFLDYLIGHNHDLQDKIFLTGYSNAESDTLMEKAIDTIAQPVNQIVQLAVQQLCYRLDNPDTPGKDYLLKGTLRMRSSCDADTSII